MSDIDDPSALDALIDRASEHEADPAAADTAPESSGTDVPPAADAADATAGSGTEVPTGGHKPRGLGRVGFRFSEGSDNGDHGTADLLEAESELDVAALVAERDSYLADSQRLAADFANYRKQSDKRVADAAAAQSAGLVRGLLPVLDACDSALEQDPESPVAPIRGALIGELEKTGLELLAPSEGEPFDPELHEAVMHEAGDDADGPTVAEVFRSGYVWKGKVVRPAMVKVVG